MQRRSSPDPEKCAKTVICSWNRQRVRSMGHPRAPRSMGSVAIMRVERLVSSVPSPSRKRTHNAVVQPAGGGGGDADAGTQGAGANELEGLDGGEEGEERLERPISSVSSPLRGHATPLRTSSFEATDAESLHILQHGYKQGFRTLSRTSSLDDREAVVADHAKMHKWSVPASQAAASKFAFASASRARVSAP